MSERFSSQYRVLMNLVVAQIDQNHPEIRASLNDLKSQLATAQQALTDKLTTFERDWSTIATARNLQPDTVAYNLQLATWLGQVRFGDQISTYSQDIDALNAQIYAVRAAKYTTSELAALDNYSNLSTAYNIARPWTANVERSYKQGGTPLTEALLADPRNWTPAQFDSSPLVLPVGDLVAFITAPASSHSFDTSSYQYHLDHSESSWTASGGASFLGWSIGGGGSGSSSITHSMTKLNSLSISFNNIAEYLVDRSAWFNPGVLQDTNIQKLISTRPELRKLQFVSVSLIVARGIKIVLSFSEGVETSAWSKSSFAASGGCSFFGCSFGGGGGSSSSNYSVDVTNNATTVTIADADGVARVVGSRVESFITSNPLPTPDGLNSMLQTDANVKADAKAVLRGRLSYSDYQKRKLARGDQLRRPQ
jgi:hypothetical protein